MSKKVLRFPANYWPRRVLTGAVLLWTALSIPLEANAATALVRWLPRGSEPVSGYKVYVRNSGSNYAASVPWSGNPTPAADGSMSAVVPYTPYAPAGSGTNYFAVVAVSSATGEESALSAELPIGTSNPCRNDSCSSKTTCDFTNRANGISCDDASFCNGPEVCSAGVCDGSATLDCSDAYSCTIDACDDVAGRCTHTAGSPGCCLACDSTDPCLADACAQGDCTAGPGTEIEVNRVRILNRTSGVKLYVKGRFAADPALDPSQTGVVIELLSPDGAVLYSSVISGPLISAGNSGGKFRFATKYSGPEDASNGVTRLSLQLKGSTWLVIIQGETPQLMDAFQEPTMTLLLRFGGTCVRRIDMPCAQKETVSLCR